MDTVICKELIVSTIARRGNGTEVSPIRVITQVFEKDGTLIAEYDPAPDGHFVLMDLVNFARYCRDTVNNNDEINPADVDRWIKSLNK